ncbi:MAG: M20/M25/M40 family metallo-hydrolase [Aureliella sp.]
MKKINEKRAIALVMRLMAIPGKSCEESKIAEEVVAVLSAAGVPSSAFKFDTAHRRSPAGGALGNLVVKLPGSGSKSRSSRLMLSAHLDTVPICVGCVPKRKGKAIISANPDTGLGADDRAGVAAAITAFVEARESGEDLPPITLCFFVQEEIGLHGSRYMTTSKLGAPSMALNFDGGDPYKMTIGATGGERMKFHLRGLPAHAGLAPEEGASAVHAAGVAIGQLVGDKWLGRIRKDGKQGTSNIGVVQGGNATNVVAPEAEVTAEARSHDSAFRTRIADAIEKAFRAAAKRTKAKDGTVVQIEVERRVDYDSFRLAADSEVVKQAATAINTLGVKPEKTISNGGVDANWLNKHGIPTVTVGCGQRDVHTKNESLDIDDFIASCAIGKHMILNAG